MKNWIFILLLIGFQFNITSCKKDKNQPNPTPTTPHPINLSDAQKKVVASDNAFGFNLLRDLHQQNDPNKNIIISPLSISMALGMTLNGAAGDTRTAMETALEKTNLTSTEINESYRKLLDELPTVDPSTKMQIANSIWYRQEFPVLTPFINTNQTYFDAQVNALDFDDPGAVNTINNWVKDKTEQKIEKIIDEISDDHVMFLINAIYFKGSWQWKFDKNKTQSYPFTLNDNSQVNVQMMHHDEVKFWYYGDSEVQVASLPYGRGNYSMMLMKPNSLSLDALIQQINSNKFKQWVDGLDTMHNLHFYMPKFELEYEKELKEALTARGMGMAFAFGADFSGINTEKWLHLSEVKHKTYIKVDEEGTEAAAVTSVGVVVTSLPASFMLDSPFLLAIRENSTGSIVFLGKIVNPLEK